METNETTGTLAAIAAPFFMALGFIIWDVTWKSSGGSAFALNMFKCNLASIGFLIMCFILGWSTSNGIGVTKENNNEWNVDSIGYLILSGFIGIILGDLAWLEALRLLGVTKVLIIDSIKPFSAALIGWIVLDESINNIAYSGIFLTVVGILIVSLEKGNSEKDEIDDNDSDNLNLGEDVSSEVNQNFRSNDRNKTTVNIENNNTKTDYDENELERSVVVTEIKENVVVLSNYRGFVLAVVNILLDTYGSVLTKQHGLGMSTWAINLIRFGSSGIIMISISILLRIFKWFEKRKGTKSNAAHDNVGTVTWYELPTMSSRSWGKISIGVLFVTFLCPALSVYALFQIALALALTLGSITPLYALFLEWSLHGESKKPTLRSTVGAFLSVAGVVILSIWQ